MIKALVDIPNSVLQSVDEGALTEVFVTGLAWPRQYMSARAGRSPVEFRLPNMEMATSLAKCLIRGGFYIVPPSGGRTYYPGCVVTSITIEGGE